MPDYVPVYPTCDHAEAELQARIIHLLAKMCFLLGSSDQGLSPTEGFMAAMQSFYARIHQDRDVPFGQPFGLEIKMKPRRMDGRD